MFEFANGKVAHLSDWETPSAYTELHPRAPKKTPSTAPCQHQGSNHGTRLCCEEEPQFSPWIFFFAVNVHCIPQVLRKKNKKNHGPFAQLSKIESERARNETLHDWNLRVTACVLQKSNLALQARTYLQEKLATCVTDLPPEHFTQPSCVSTIVTHVCFC